MSDDAKLNAAQQRFSRYSNADRYNWQTDDQTSIIDEFPGDSLRIIEEAYQPRPSAVVLEMPPRPAAEAPPVPTRQVRPNGFATRPAAPAPNPPAKRAAKTKPGAAGLARAFQQKMLRRFVGTKPVETTQNTAETPSKVAQKPAFLARVSARVSAVRNAVQPGQAKSGAAVSKPGTAVVTVDEKKSSRFEGLKQKAKLALLISARTVRHHTRREELQRKYLRSLIFVHGKVFDRKIEPLFFRPTVTPTHNQVVVANAPLTYEGPVPKLVFDWAMSALPADLKGFAFVDFRAQRGRAILLAAHRNFDKIIGYEYNENGFDDLQMNVAQFPRSPMVCRNIEVLRGDRDGLEIPPQQCVLYFSNAYREKYLSFVMDHAAASYKANPRRMYVILENTRPNTVLGHDEIFYKMPLPVKERVMSHFFSPISVDVYRSLV